MLRTMIIIAATVSLGACSSGTEEVQPRTYDTIASYRGDDPKIDAAINSAMDDDKITREERDRIFDRIDAYQLKKSKDRFKAGDTEN